MPPVWVMVPVLWPLEAPGSRLPRISVPPPDTPVLSSTVPVPLMFSVPLPAGLEPELRPILLSPPWMLSVPALML